MKRPPTNIAHSVRARLLKVAKERGEQFQYTLTLYAIERLLVRLAASKHGDTFVLKGAMLFRVWSSITHRATKDLDLLGSGAPDLDRLASVFAEICTVAVEDDGIQYDPASVRAARIKEDADYEGVRITLRANLGTARLELQVDVGFGDAITPAPVEIVFPTLLPMPAPRLLAYPKETVVAEKLNALVELGVANSRMKDFFDLRPRAPGSDDRLRREHARERHRSDVRPPANAAPRRAAPRAHLRVLRQRRQAEAVEGLHLARRAGRGAARPCHRGPGALPRPAARPRGGAGALPHDLVAPRAMGGGRRVRPTLPTCRHRAPHHPHHFTRNAPQRVERPGHASLGYSALS